MRAAKAFLCGRNGRVNRRWLRVAGPKPSTRTLDVLPVHCGGGSISRAGEVHSEPVSRNASVCDAPVGDKRESSNHTLLRPLSGAGNSGTRYPRREAFLLCFRSLDGTPTYRRQRLRSIRVRCLSERWLCGGFVEACGVQTSLPLFHRGAVGRVSGLFVVVENGGDLHAMQKRANEAEVDGHRRGGGRSEGAQEACTGGGKDVPVACSRTPRRRVLVSRPRLHARARRGLLPRASTDDMVAERYGPGLAFTKMQGA